MEIEIRGYQGTVLSIQGTVIAKSSFDPPRVAYYEVELYEAGKKATIKFDNDRPEEIKPINK